MADEAGLIARHFGPLARHPGAHGLSDDTSTLPLPDAGEVLVSSVDATFAGIHLPAEARPSAIARKGLRRALSDLAAAGAVPRGALVSLFAAASWGEAEIAGFAAGLGSDLDQFDVPLLGGDLVRIDGAPGVSITVFGSTPAPLLRADARPGDLLAVTNHLGAAAAAFHQKERGAGQGTGPYWLPEPRLELSRALHGLANAAIDISDGIFRDAHNLAAASRTCIALDLNAVPLAPLPATLSREAALAFGDDYEVLIALPEARFAPLERAARGCGMTLTAIGAVQARDGGPALRDARTNGAIAADGFSHF